MRTVSVSIFSAVFGATTTVALPVFAQTDIWAILGEVQIDEVITDTSYEVKKTLPKQLDDGITALKITGYAMPLTPGMKSAD